MSGRVGVLFAAAAAFSLADHNNNLGRTPQMGWNSWNSVYGNVNETFVMQIADGLISSGLAAKGYKYVNLDDGVMLVNRTRDGRLQPDPAKFTDGSLTTLAKYIHGKGLKFGVYSCAGTKTCLGRAGSYGHEDIDAHSFAEWGVDYLKLDWCYAQDTARHRYPIMSQALNSTGRPIFFSMCEWGYENPWEWGPAVANSWRTWEDVCNYWHTHPEIDGCAGVSEIIQQNEQYHKYAGPGGWNDPSLLVTGNTYMHKGVNMTLSEAEFRSQFSLWCMMASPLMISADIRRPSAMQLAILGNEEVVAVNQDPLGVQGHIVWRTGELGHFQVWAKQLHDGGVAIALFNNDDGEAAKIGIAFSVLGFETARCRDLWLHQDMGVVTGGFARHVAVHETHMFRCTPSQ